MGLCSFLQISCYGAGMYLQILFKIFFYLILGISLFIKLSYSFVSVCIITIFISAFISILIFWHTCYGAGMSKYENGNLLLIFFFIYFGIFYIYFLFYLSKIIFSLDFGEQWLFVSNLVFFLFLLLLLRFSLFVFKFDFSFCRLTSHGANICLDWIC